MNEVATGFRIMILAVLSANGKFAGLKVLVQGLGLSAANSLQHSQSVCAFSKTLMLRRALDMIVIDSDGSSQDMMTVAQSRKS